MTKQELLQEVADILKKHLDDGSYVIAPAAPQNGNLPMDIAYVRVEPWVYGTETVTLDGAWGLAVETALQWNKVPVLAHQFRGMWLFRVPVYMCGPEYEQSIVEEDWHAFDFSIDVAPVCFAMVLSKYQELRDERDGFGDDQEYRDLLSIALGEV